MDDDGSNSLNLAEFEKAMHELNVTALDGRALQDLFSHFDSDGSGCISFNEFLSKLRDPTDDVEVDAAAGHRAVDALASTAVDAGAGMSHRYHIQGTWTPPVGKRAVKARSAAQVRLR
jgi:Ca2+-binding EF-hand superfamily protein